MPDEELNEPALNPMSLVIAPPGSTPGAPSLPQAVSGPDTKAPVTPEPPKEAKAPPAAKMAPQAVREPAPQAEAAPQPKEAPKAAPAASQASQETPAAAAQASQGAEAKAPEASTAAPDPASRKTAATGTGSSAKPGKQPKPGAAHPMKPKTEEEVALFREAVVSGKESFEEIAARYGVSRRTVGTWAKEFKTARGPGKANGYVVGNADTIGRSAERAVEAAAAAVGAVVPGILDPKKDPQICALLTRINEAVPEAGTMADLARVQRLLLKLLTSILDKAPIKSWDSLGSAAAEMYRMLLYARRVEADLPPSHDPVALRQDAARELLQELGAVLTKEEQDQVNGLLREAARRLKAKQAEPAVEVVQ